MTKAALFESNTFHGNLENALSAQVYEFHSGEYNIICFDDLIGLCWLWQLIYWWPSIAKCF